MEGKELIRDIRRSAEVSWEAGQEFLSNTGSKSENMMKNAVASVYIKTVGGVSLVGGLAGGIVGGTVGTITGGAAGAAAGFNEAFGERGYIEAAAALGRGVRDASGEDSFMEGVQDIGQGITSAGKKLGDMDVKRAVKLISGGAIVGSVIGGTGGTAAGATVAGAGAGYLSGVAAIPMLAPFSEDAMDSPAVGALIGTTAGAAAGSALIAGRTVAAVAAGSAMEAVSDAAQDTMEAAVITGYAFANGINKTTKEVMSNVTGIAKALKKNIEEGGAELVDKAVDGIRSGLKATKEMAGDALEAAGNFLSDVGIKDIIAGLPEPTIVDKAMAALETAFQLIVPFSVVGSLMLWSDSAKTRDGAVGSIWVGPHSRNGIDIKGYYRRAARRNARSNYWTA